MGQRFLFVGAVVAVALFAPSKFRFAPQTAGACSLQSHCYGVVQWQNAPSSYGSIEALNVAQDFNNDQCNGFVSAQMWTGTQNAGDGISFVGVGLYNGRHYGGACGSGRQWFWEEQPNLAIYHQYFLGGSFAYNTGYALRISYPLGGTGFEVYISSNYKGVSNQSCCAKFLSAGLEVAVDANISGANGGANSLQKQSSSTGSWSYGWGGSIIQDPPISAFWKTSGISLAYVY